MHRIPADRMANLHDTSQFRGLRPIRSASDKNVRRQACAKGNGATRQDLGGRSCGYYCTRRPSCQSHGGIARSGTWTEQRRRFRISVRSRACLSPCADLPDATFDEGSLFDGVARGFVAVAGGATGAKFAALRFFASRIRRCCRRRQ